MILPCVHVIDKEVHFTDTFYIFVTHNKESQISKKLLDIVTI